MMKKNVKNRKYIKENEKGISLITLVITIGIIFILGGTTINIVLGETGVFKKSKETQNMQQNYINSEDTQTNSLINNVNQELKEDWQDGSGANRPKLSVEMVPVKWDGSNWIVTNKKDNEWFNYAEKKWANIMLRDGLKVEGIENVATVSLESMQGKKVIEVGSMFVWIPRYGYQITNGYHLSGADLNSENPELGAGTINIEFLKGTTDVGVNGRKTWDNRSGQGNWNVHPAFDYNGAVEGIWVAKFEASHAGCTTDVATGETGAEISTLTLQVKPGVSSWRNITIGDIYTVCLNYDENVINNSNLNSHMMKNSEWGAVAYLTQSEYGKNNEVWINNSSSYITGSVGNSAVAEKDVGITNDYTSTQGVNASTTGNIYGIYDMSGGAWEYMVAYINNSTENIITYGAAFINSSELYTKEIYVGETNAINDNSKYNYNANLQVYGDAIYETSMGTYNESGESNKKSWNSDISIFPYSDAPFFIRGGRFVHASGSGLFSFERSLGQNSSYYGFRPILIVK